MPMQHGFAIRLLTTSGCLAMLLAGGCGYSMSSLATNTGPLKGAGPWSVAKEQWVHVGETFDVSYALYSGGADYALLTVSPLGTNKVSLGADRGRFHFDNLRFMEPTPPDRPLVLHARAFRERGERDHMELDGQLISRESPFDVSDRRMASASLRIHVYQSNVAIDVAPDPAGYRWETARLLLYASPERPTEVLGHRDYRKGFRVSGPTAGGSFVVAYEPAADQVKRTESTRVVFTVQNAAGHEYRRELWLPTP